MKIEWDNLKRKAFREALEKAYPSDSALKRFVDERLDKNLETISSANKNLSDQAFDLINWAKKEGKLDYLLKAFEEDQPNNPLLTWLKSRSLISRSSKKIAEEDWEILFVQFVTQDFADLHRAFLGGFKQALNLDFYEARPDFPAITAQAQIQELLVIYGQPNLAVKFVQQILIEFQRSQQDRDLTALEHWRDRIAQQYQISLDPPKPSLSDRQGYLLISLQESPLETQKDASFVTVFAELHVTGEPKAIGFGATPETCPFHQVSDHLSRLIQKAEDVLIDYDCGEVTVELFLPCIYLEENVAEWEVKNEQNRLRQFGLHRSFVVRSLDRAETRRIHVTLKQKWERLKTCTEIDLYHQFHNQETCPTPGILLSHLIKKTGLRFLAELPTDREQRLDILYDIINSAVPIALWSTQFEPSMAGDLEIQFNQILQASRLTNFVDLAQQWRVKRAELNIKHIRLLCDYPDRFPNLPDPTQEEDLLVAS